MKSFLNIATTEEDVDIKAKLRISETTELELIRHYFVEKVTKLLNPNCQKITFKFKEDK